MTVNVQYAEEHFANLISAVHNGEEVETVRLGKPALLLSPCKEAPAPSDRQPRQLGRLKGLIEVPTEEEWSVMAKEITRDQRKSTGAS